MSDKPKPKEKSIDDMMKHIVERKQIKEVLEEAPESARLVLIVATEDQFGYMFAGTEQPEVAESMCQQMIHTIQEQLYPRTPFFIFDDLDDDESDKQT